MTPSSIANMKRGVHSTFPVTALKAFALFSYISPILQVVTENDFQHGLDLISRGVVGNIGK